MSKEFTPEVQFFNLTWKVGELNLLDVAPSIVLPAIFSGDTTTSYGKNSFILRPQIVDVVRRDGTAEPAVFFEIVVDSVLRRDQVWDDEAKVLRRDEQLLRDSPSSQCILILSSHRLIVFKHLPRAPLGRQVAQTLRGLSKPIWEQWLRTKVDILHRRGIRASIAEQRRAFPNSVNALPFSSPQSIGSKIGKFSLISSLSLTLRRTNAQLDTHPIYEAMRERNRLIKGSDVIVQYKPEDPAKGLDHQQTKVEVVESTKSGTTEVLIRGKDKEQNDLKVSNDDVSVRVKVSIDPALEIEELSQDLLDVYEEQEDQKIIPMMRGRHQEDAHRRAAEVVQAYRSIRQ